MIQLAKLNVPTARFRVLQAQELHKIEQKFEGIISGFLIPYLSKSALQNFIKNINLLLQDNGVVYLSFVEGNYEQSNYQVSASGNKVYFHYYTSEEVKEYLLQYNITLLKTFLIPYPDTNNLGTQIHTAMIAQKAIQ
jgi:cyclopropane fatty-acyl-phospholipid synthase-like methyltransferase